ncbi:hypothetical protein [uncultured Fibrobacter sp.]|uniref:hypothetical protein n=1 Tax=uncultured Fibrobacter sp. TaxID=261512 RepID=UPI002606BD63|nr:hypothetical protein [uncultured Fibrobacter sp.]
MYSVEDSKKAYLQEAGKNWTQVELLFVQDYDYVDADLSIERYGDTLSVEYVDVRSQSTHKCFSRHLFYIPVEKNGIKYFSFHNVVYEVVRDYVGGLN